MWIDGSWAALTPPFGAMAVLVFSACKAPLAQPRNVIVGNFIGGTVGYLVWTFMHELCVLLGKADADLLWPTSAAPGVARCMQRRWMGEFLWPAEVR